MSATHDTGWTVKQRRQVFAALLSTWPDTLGTWGREVISTYIGELEARGLTSDQVLTAIRTWEEESNFPPAVPRLAAAARRDPSTPTFEEMLQLVYGPGGILQAAPAERVFSDMVARNRAYTEAAKQRARELHPLVGSFVLRHGVERLRGLELDHPEHGGLKREDLRRAWDEHATTTDTRAAVAMLANRRGDGLQALDPLAALGVGQRQIEDGGEE